MLLLPAEAHIGGTRVRGVWLESTQLKFIGEARYDVCHSARKFKLVIILAVELRARPV